MSITCRCEVAGFLDGSIDVVIDFVTWEIADVDFFCAESDGDGRSASGKAIRTCMNVVSFPRSDNIST